MVQGADRPPVVHVTWQRHAGRAEEIAAALGGRALHVHPGSGDRRRSRVLLRYARSVALTAGGLARLRPRSVVVTNPPVFPGLVVAGYSALARTPFLLDSHTSSFGVKGNTVARRLLGVHRWLARRAAGVMVTTTDWVEVVDGWGGRGLIVHEAPPASIRTTPPPGGSRVLFVGVFADDEPVREVVEAARLLPDVEVAITGDLARCPAGLRESAPANVEFVGFLGPAEYRAEVERACVVLTLTTEPTSIMRAGYEAVYAGRPLVVSDWPALREVFPFAGYTSHEPAAMAAALRAALQDRDPTGSREQQALEAQNGRWQEQLSAMRTALGLDRAPAVAARTSADITAGGSRA